MTPLLTWLLRLLGIEAPQPLTQIERERYEAMNAEEIEREKGYGSRPNSPHSGQEK